MEAAVDCGADTDPDSTRFFLIDRQAWPMSEEEHGELMKLALRASLQQLRLAVKRREHEVEELRGRISSLSRSKPGR
jgi:hypothetical protein